MILLQRLAGAVLGIALFAAALIFTSVILAIAALVAIAAWAWLWWRTRHLRREVQRRGGAVVEGEFRVEPEARLDDKSR